ncbi:hypothetical protein ACFPT7_11295 [Acidicapsa dinghuensis]|uniref:Membrane protein 6-pyruvoyl-tetrahydropterin synthase-related domain-containing protein n=1 Tax=Acidicapsa dinghuensis TaxID=2218256 RepID=A0ABW1EEX1_9BACT|nr:hypothetical protein [Acidicapsa dinghuensis]
MAATGGSNQNGAFARVWRGLKWGDGALWIPLAALFVAGSVRVLRGVSCGHDFEFHLISWMETKRAWSQGVLYPHWAQTPNWDAGEPRFVFYPPLTWMLGALLGYLLPWTILPSALVFLILTATGFAVRAMLRGLASSWVSGGKATLAGVIAAATPYGLFTAYERTAFSELAAAVAIPLVLLFAWKEPDRSAGVRGFDRWILWLALVIAATWLTNAPSGVMACYLLMYAVSGAALLRREWWPMIRAAIALPVGLGLAACYLVPAAVEQKWIDIGRAVDVGMRVQDSWLFARHASPDLSYHDQVLRTASVLVVLTVVLACAGFVTAWRSGKLPRDGRAIWIPLAALIPVILLLQFPVSAPLWSWLPKLAFLQFPWRWLMVLNLSFAIFLAISTPWKSLRWRLGSAAGWAVVLVLFTALGTLFFYQYCDNEDDVGNQKAVFQANSGVDGTDEYAALDSDNSLISSDLPDACLVTDATKKLGESQNGSEPDWYPEQGSCDQTFTAQLWQNEHKIFQINADHAGFVVLRLSRYPAWRIMVNGKPAENAPEREDGLIAVPVSEGDSTLDVRWHNLADDLWGDEISAAAVVVLAGMWFAIRRRRSMVNL